jgi:hypothetical protein
MNPQSRSAGGATTGERARLRPFYLTPQSEPAFIFGLSTRATLSIG